LDALIVLIYAGFIQLRKKTPEKTHHKEGENETHFFALCSCSHLQLLRIR